ncbi:MAG: hypothetical protein HQ498_15360 [Pseudohongiella sp.]|nr:hypothetical protein [Pseudohongiella sp.]
MNKIYSITQHDDITEIKFNSPPNPQDGMAATLDLAARKVGRKRLWDMSCGYNNSTEELKKFAQVTRGLALPDKSKVAVVALDDLSFGVTRIYSAVRHDRRSQHQVFRDRDQAIAWLNEPFDEDQGPT